MQGWEPIYLNSNSLVDNSKCNYFPNLVKLKIMTDDGNYLYYEASRSKESFSI